MRRVTAVVPLLLVVALGLPSLLGCAGTRGEEIPDDPVMIQKELAEIEVDIANAEEMLKGSKAQLQIEDNQDLRNEIRSIEMDLYHLKARKRALEERLDELAAEGKS